MNFFYSENIDDNHITLEGEEMIHCTKSLRNKIGDTICVIDGNGAVSYTHLTLPTTPYV